MVTRAQAQAYLRHATSAIDARDWAAFERLHHPDIFYVTPISRCVGRAAFRQRFEELVAAVPDLSLQLRTITTEPVQNRVVFEAIQHGTLQAPLATKDGTVPATGRPFTLHSTLIVTFDDDGLVISMRSYFDTQEPTRRTRTAPK